MFNMAEVKLQENKYITFKNTTKKNFNYLNSVVTMRTTYYNTKTLCILPQKSICVLCVILMWNISYQSSLFIQRGELLFSKEKPAFYFSVSIQNLFWEIDLHYVG
jgi:hypothetical protein